MRYFLTEKEIAIKEKARRFAREHISPLAQKLDEESSFPNDILKLMGKEGYLGLFVPEEYGGSGGGVMDLSVAVEEISRICCGVATSYATNALATFPIMLFGNEAQKQKFLTPVAKGERLAAFALTEPNAGSDAGAVQTTAVKDGDCYILNGTKQWITNGGEAEIYTVFTTIDRSRGARGMTAFILEKGTPGFSFGKKEDKLGIRSSTTRILTFENCKVPTENMLGRPGHGFVVAMRTFDKARPGVGAEAVGIAQGALDKVMNFILEKQNQGHDFLSWQSVQGKIADMATQLEASRTLVYTVARMIDEGAKDTSAISAMSKLYASETAMEVSRKAMAMMAEFGVSQQVGLEKMLRDAKITEIYEGTSEIQKEIIALGLVRSYRKGI